MAVRRTIAIEKRGASGTATISIEASDYDDPVDIEAPNVSDGMIWKATCRGG
ncbi:MAG: hypothetical protein ABEJ59_02660 [Halanaeroarchaeum sp.]